MAVNRGKQFEEVIKRSFEKVEGVSIDRIHDQTNGYLGSSNICDFIVYRKPHEYYIECKSVHGNTLPFRNISKNQLQGLYEKSKINGVIAGVICWWVDHDETWFIPIWVIHDCMEVTDEKSINLKKPYLMAYWKKIKGKKKRVFFEYDMKDFIERIEHEYLRKY